MSIAIVVLLAGGWAAGNPEKLAAGRIIYEQACAACHGSDGNGNPSWQSEVRPVAFSDCGTTAEPTLLWEAIVREGGTPYGLDAVMPAFEGAYDDDEISAVVSYLRTFCANADAYPPGDLNFRRLLKTGKAFPEAEWVLRMSHRPDSETRETELEIVYENRIGPRFQYEIEAPVRLQAREEGDGTGVGDVTLGAKQVLHFDPGRWQILSAGVDVTLPTGHASKGLGDDTVKLAPYAAFGKAWDAGRFILQARAGLTLPVDGDEADGEATYGVALARAFGLPRKAWTPAVELVGAVDLDTGRHDYGVWLEVSKPLNKLGHVIGSAGVQIPIRPGGASARLEMYVLWDFGDGPIWVGW